jgi:AraC-like DNA-binding protein
MKSAAKVHTLSGAVARDPAVRSWSTDPVAAQHRLDYWRGALDAAYGGLLQWQSGLGTLGMSASLRNLSLPGVQLGELRGVGQRLAYTGDELHPVLVVVDAEHEWEVEQGGAVEPVRAGDVALVHAAPGTALDFRYGVRATVLAGSRPWAQRWLGGLRDRSLRVSSGQRGWGRILSSVLQELGADPEIAANETGSVVAEMIGAQLAAALRTEPAPRFASDLVADARRMCSERLYDAELSVREVAQLLGVSVRTLTRAFEDAGTTFSESLREMRLLQAAALLANPDLVHLTVAEIGQQCGFVSASHFVREFRRRWGHTPGQSRAGAAHSEVFARLDRMMTETRQRVEAQKSRIDRLSEIGSQNVSAALDLLHSLEGSLATLESLRENAHSVRQVNGRVGPQS